MSDCGEDEDIVVFEVDDLKEKAEECSKSLIGIVVLLLNLQKKISMSSNLQYRSLFLLFLACVLYRSSLGCLLVR
ncbi:hypothetical protein L6164_004939 [Bauhinia variegata]|uniref:Uncharacterized protein n=1 Tax=Bauhinia variegata TaxID=167791 RepID=A0ACB9PP86_BAUVA|nr:hypothetical protein L6164_004939 [Bauhinia variegata]